MDVPFGTDPEVEGPALESTVVEDASTDGMEQDATDETSTAYVGRWNRLISTTNWEKGRIISDWRECLIQSGAPAQAYSDEAWSRRVGNVSPQHAGRLRRVWTRFGKLREEREEYQGLYWSHFQAGLDWDDAEMWLQGAVAGWSVAQMRAQRWEANGAPADQKPHQEEIVTAEFDEDVDLPTDPVDDVIDSSTAMVRDPSDPDVPPVAGEESVARVPSNVAAPIDDQPAVVEPVRPFENLPQLPDDLQDAFEAFKLAILSHKLARWEEISRDAVLVTLDALKELVLAPSET